MPPWLDPRTAYVHVPFCAHHCGYCDFAVTAGNDHLIDPTSTRSRLELATLGEPRPVETLFIGGGTPTYLNRGPTRARLLEASRRRWLPSSARRRAAEFSIESTPDSLDEEKAALLAALGVTRVSVGVQSFRPELARRPRPPAHAPNTSRGPSRPCAGTSRHCRST